MLFESMSIRLVSPGSLLRRELEARGWSEKVLERIIGRPPETLAALLSGDDPLTPEIAEVLSSAFGTSVEFWVKLEAAYRQTRAID